MASNPRTSSQSSKKYPPVSMGGSYSGAPKFLPPKIRSSPSICNVHGIYVPQYADQYEFTHRDAFDISAGNLYRFLGGLRDGRLVDDVGLFIWYSLILSHVGLHSNIFSLIEAPEPLALLALEKPFTSIPTALLSYTATRNAFGSGTSLTPEWRQTSGLSFVDNYLHMANAARISSLETGVHGYELGVLSIRSMPLAVWTGGRLSGVPIIMVMGQWDVSDVMKFIRHCEGDCRRDKTRYRRLQECPQWIYHDLYSTFTDWNDIWDAVQINLEELDQEVHELLGTGNVLERMRKINKAIAANIMLRESLAIQGNSLQAVNKLAESRWSESPNKVQLQFMERCKEMFTSLDHYSVLATGNLEQLQNLVSMMVSLEQIAQGNSVARLNILAFTFLPLSFIAVSISFYYY